MFIRTLLPYPVWGIAWAAGYRGTSVLEPRTAHMEIDYGHGRIVKQSLWVTGAEAWTPRLAVLICRDGYDAVKTLICKEILPAVTTLDAERATLAGLGGIARGIARSQ